MSQYYEYQVVEGFYSSFIFIVIPIPGRRGRDGTNLQHHSEALLQASWCDE
jgi:hypothetical protein